MKTAAVKLYFTDTVKCSNIDAVVSNNCGGSPNTYSFVLFNLSHLTVDRCASVLECRICNWEVAGSNLGLGYFAPRSTQPSNPPGSVNECQL